MRETRAPLEVESQLKFHIQLNLNKILEDYQGVRQVKVVADETMRSV